MIRATQSADETLPDLHHESYGPNLRITGGETLYMKKGSLLRTLCSYGIKKDSVISFDTRGLPAQDLVALTAYMSKK